MGVLDTVSGLASRFAPSKSSKPLSGGIGSGHGMVPTGDDMIVPKPVIIFHASQIFFNFLAMACFAAVASFQAKWKVGPSGLSGFAIFTSIVGMILSGFMLLIPVAYERYDKFVNLARALKEVRVGFILTGTGVTLSLLIAFITTISAFTQPGCKDPEKDPHAEEKGDEFKAGLPGWCSTKKAGSIFFWLAFAFWAASLTLLIIDWRSGKLHSHTHRDPPFQRPAPPQDEEEGEDEDDFEHIPPARRQNSSTGGGYDNSDSTSSPFADPHLPSARYGAPSSAYTPAVAAGRPSMDAYGAFSDPAPSGFGTAGYGGRGAPPPSLPEPDLGAPMVSRTMQYADPYAAVRASIAGGGPAHGVPSSPTHVPPSYESYQGYR